MPSSPAENVIAEADRRPLRVGRYRRRSLRANLVVSVTQPPKRLLGLERREERQQAVGQVQPVHGARYGANERCRYLSVRGVSSCRTTHGVPEKTIFSRTAIIQVRNWRLSDNACVSGSG